MQDIPNDLFNYEADIDKWRSLGVPPRMVIDKPYNEFVLHAGFVIAGWLVKAGSRGLRIAAIAERLNAEGVMPHPAFAWDVCSAEKLLAADRALRGRPAPTMRPRRRRRRRKCPQAVALTQQVKALRHRRRIEQQRRQHEARLEAFALSQAIGWRPEA